MGLDDADFAMVMTVCKGNKPQAFFWCGSGNRVMCQSVEGEMEHGSITYFVSDEDEPAESDGFGVCPLVWNNRSDGANNAKFRWS